MSNENRNGHMAVFQPVYGIAHGHLIRIWLDIREGETRLDGLKRFDRIFDSDLVGRWLRGEWEFVEDFEVLDKDSLDEFTRLLDDPDRWDAQNKGIEGE